jgi:hypothetical protein
LVVYIKKNQCFIKPQIYYIPYENFCQRCPLNSYQCELKIKGKSNRHCNGHIATFPRDIHNIHAAYVSAFSTSMKIYHASAPGNVNSTWL